MSDESYGASGGGCAAYMPGILLVLFGFLILVVPRLLVLMVALFFMSLGILLILLGHKLRQSRKWNREYLVQWFDGER